MKEDFPPGVETLLLVEDEDGIRILAKNVLTMCGYTVITASTPEDAIDLFCKHDEDIAMLISDIVMPNICGPQLAETLRAKRPGLRIMFISGYADASIRRHKHAIANNPFLQKPFLPSKLAHMVRAVLDDRDE